MNLLMYAYPKGLDTPAIGWKLPLYIACETVAGADVIRWLALGFPPTIYRKDDNGETPLQLCENLMRGRRQKRVVKM